MSGKYYALDMLVSKCTGVLIAELVNTLDGAVMCYCRKHPLPFYLLNTSFNKLSRYHLNYVYVFHFVVAPLLNVTHLFATNTRIQHTWHVVLQSLHRIAQLMLLPFVLCLFV